MIIALSSTRTLTVSERALSWLSSLEPNSDYTLTLSPKEFGQQRLVDLKVGPSLEAPPVLLGNCSILPVKTGALATKIAG